MSAFDDEPDVGPDTGPAPRHDVFISYSSIDRARVNGLRELLIGLNKDVFQDHVSIPAGRRWRAELDKGITKVSSLVVFWTKHSAASDPVRVEYEWFATNRRQRPLIPILGDHTPLPPILAERQAANLMGPGTDSPVAPAYGVINDVLEMKRDLEAEGLPASQVMERVEARLKEAGVELNTKQKQRLIFLFLGFGLKEIFRRYFGEAVKQLALRGVRRLWDYRRDATMLTYATVMAFVVFKIFFEPSPPPSNSAAPPLTAGDSALVARLDSTVNTWGDIANYFDTTFDAPQDSARLEGAIQAGVRSLTEQHEITQALLLDIRARLSSGSTTAGDHRPDSVLLAGLSRNMWGIEWTGRSIARLLSRLVGGNMVPQGGDLGSIQRQLSSGFLQTYALIDDVRTMLEGQVPDGAIGGLSEDAVQRAVRGELRGPRDTLGLIYSEVIDGSVEASRVDTIWRESPDLSSKVRRIDSLTAVQQDTIREILARLPKPEKGGSRPGGVIRTVRIYVPPGPGDFSEPTPDCCATADLPYLGDGSELVDGEVTVMARISTSGEVRDVESLSVSPRENELLSTLAKDIVERWRFNPGKLRGAATEVQMFAVVVFVP